LAQDQVNPNGGVYDSNGAHLEYSLIHAE
jgi:hypothetical protein